MEISVLPISSLKPAPYNPRLALKPGDPHWEKLKRSIDEFNLVQPIIWNRRTGHVVGGHQRLEILKARGDTDVDCVIVDLTLEREQALNVALNNSELGSDWDSARLNSLLQHMQEIPEFDVTLTGFDDQQLRDMIFEPDSQAFPGLLEPESHSDGQVRATLVIPEAHWEMVEDYLNDLLAAEPDIRLHVKLPE